MTSHRFDNLTHFCEGCGVARSAVADGASRSCPAIYTEFTDISGGKLTLAVTPKLAAKIIERGSTLIAVDSATAKLLAKALRA